jgi:hypothetical protein
VKRIISRRPSPALVISCISLFVAMGGVSYGVATGSIDGREIKNNSVRGADIKNSSLTGNDVANNRLGGTDVKESSLGKVPNAGLLENQGPAQFKTRWALVGEDGNIVEQSGGFTVVSKPGTNGQPTTNPNIYISAGSSLIGKGLQVSTAIQNKIDRTGDAVVDPAFSGDHAIGRCNSAAINCVPAGTNTDNTLVVRSLEDNTDATSQTRRFYVEVTE